MTAGVWGCGFCFKSKSETRDTAGARGKVRARLLFLSDAAVGSVLVAKWPHLTIWSQNVISLNCVFLEEVYELAVEPSTFFIYYLTHRGTVCKPTLDYYL